MSNHGTYEVYIDVRHHPRYWDDSEEREGTAFRFVDTGNPLQMVANGLRIFAEELAPEPSITLESLAGPSETMEAAGLTNRGSLAWAMEHRGFPEPIKVLKGIRLWDLEAVTDWKNAQGSD